MPLSRCYIVTRLIVLIAGISMGTYAVAQRNNLTQVLAAIDSLHTAGEHTLANGKLATLEGRAAEMSMHEAGRYEKLLATQRYRSGNMEKAKLGFRRSRYFFSQSRESDATEIMANLYTNIAAADYTIGAYEAAMDTLQAGLAFAKALPDTITAKVVASMYTMLANVQERTEQFGAAIDNALLAVASLEAIGESEGRKAAFVHNTLGTIYQRVGRYDESSYHYQRAHSIFNSFAPDYTTYAFSALSNDALNARMKGEVDRVITIFSSKLNQLLGSPDIDKTILTNTYLNLGQAYAQLGELAQAKRSLEQALGTWKEVMTEPHLKEVNILRSLADAYFRSNQLAEAQQMLRRGIAVHEALEMSGSSELTRLLELAGEVFTADAQLDSATFVYQRASELATAREGGFVYEVSDARGNYIQALLRQGKLVLAKAEIEKLRIDLLKYRAELAEIDLLHADATYAILSVRWALLSSPNQPIEQASVIQLETIRDTYSAYVQGLRGRLNQRVAAVRNVGPSAVYQTLTEAYLHNYMLDANQPSALLRAAILSIGDALDFVRSTSQLARQPGLDAQQRTYLKRLSMQASAYAELESNTEGNSEDSRKLRAEYRDSVIQLEDRMSTVLPVADLSNDLQDELDRYQAIAHEAMLIPFLGINDTYLITSAQSGFSCSKVTDAAAFYKDIDTYRSFVKQATAGFRESANALAAGVRLYEQLLMATGLQNADLDHQVVQVLRTGVIDQVSLATLPMAQSGGESYRDVAFAVMKYSFVYQSSLRAMLRAEASEKSFRGLKVLAVSPLTGRTTTPQEATLGALPAVEAVIEFIGSQFSTTRCEGANATVQNLTNLHLGNQVIHLASHARSEPTDGRFSYILLCDTMGVARQKYYANSISELDLDTKLVVLGACETGDGAVRAGEGSVSLASVFLEAGANSAVSTLWRVDDKQSAKLVKGFYTQLRGGNSLESSLATAQREFIHSAGSQYAHPYYWGGFVLTGTTGALTYPSQQIGLGVLSILGVLVLAALGYRATLGRP